MVGADGKALLKVMLYCPRLGFVAVKPLAEGEPFAET